MILTRDHDVYDRVTDTWTSNSQAPAIIAAYDDMNFQLFGATVGQDVYVMILGDWPYKWQGMEVYNEQTEAWSSRSGEWVLDGYRAFRMVGCRDRIIMAENRGAFDYLAFQEYSVSGDSWTDKGQTTFQVEGGAICHLIGKVYFCGGQGYSFRKNYEYNPNTFTCTEKADPPYIVRTEEPTYDGYIQISQVGDDFCAGTQGGVIVSSPFYYSDYFLCVYDPKTDTWTSQARVWPEGHWYQGQFCDGGIS